LMPVIPAAVQPVPLGSLEHEVKYIVPASAAPALASWLGSACLPERRYPPARVVSVYLDTPDLARLGEKIDSDYLKSKVRIRWYAPLDGPGQGIAFAEVKRRVGNRRDKPRLALGIDASELERWRLDDPRWHELIETIARSELGAGQGMLPALRLSYTRHRFVEPFESARVVLDTAIAATAAHPRISGRVPALLDLAVLEAKGASPDLPRALRPAVRFGARRGSLSKYLACYLAVTGSVL
jgi:hypothetical protein